MYALDANGGAVFARPRCVRARTMDALATYDSVTIDSTGAFLVGQLENLDPLMHMPLADFQWARDIDLRPNVSISDETTSFTVSSFGASGGLTGSGKAWVSDNVTAMPNIAMDKGKIATPLIPWGAEVSYTIFELQQSMALGTSIDVEKLEALRLKFNMDTDMQVYVGDAGLGMYGLTNLNLRSDSSAVTNLAAVPATGNGSSTLWSTKSPAQILTDINEILMSRWTASGFVLMDTRLLLPTSQYGYISSQTVSTAGNVSILTYVLENNFVTRSGGKLEMLPSKWLNGRGVGGTPETLGTIDRMVAYTKEINRVRFPMVPMQRTNVQFRSLWQVMPYYAKLGAVECPYPEAIAYRDGI